MGLPELLGGATLAALVLYALLGGADYGGGVWDLLARGPRAAAQRDLIAHSIGPVWEANHVWLVLAVVLLFVCFPPAFARLGTELHIPLTLALVGIVLRGSAFTFRSYDLGQDEAQRRFGRVFAVASVGTPLLLGVVLGTVASGRLDPGAASFVDRFVLPWLAPFPLAVGAFALVLFAYLAAVYLTLEAEARDLQEIFRRRAMVSGVLAGVLALTVFLLSGSGAPTIRRGLASSPWTWPLQLATAAAALGALSGLARRRFHLARLCAAAQVALVLLGWGAAQYPRLIEPDLTLRDAAAPEATLRLVAWALLAGAAVLVPSLLYLFRVFKGGLLSGPRPPAAP
ncbi:MAG TPA: cytochrome d ubiquinol oxidase subunit II [Candidatus Polarisedimenticolaceae bacterium]|nr:cytochrome d ubiquinol oxidase subunit II [Candidatus Polarisedimenticolaceae bacterium]